MKPTILFLIADYGGHKSLAEATAEALHEHFTEKFVTPIESVVPQFSISAFHFMAVNIPAIWGTLYQITDRPPLSFLPGKLMELLTYRRIENLIQKTKPAVVVSNFSLYGSVLQLLSHKYNFKTAVMIADPFSIHASWFTNPGVDLYIAPTPKAKQAARNSGVTKQKIIVSGWPLRKQFQQQYDHEKTRQTLKFSPQVFTIYIGGSVSAGLDITRLVHSISRVFAGKKLQVIAVCGNNTRVQTASEQIVTRKDHLIRIFGFIKEVSPLMAIADIIVSKAGPNVMIEALTLGKPFLAASYLPGQETGNIAYIKEKGIGWVILDPDEVARWLLTLSTDPKELDRVKVNLQNVQIDFLFESKFVAKTIAHLLPLESTKKKTYTPRKKR